MRVKIGNDWFECQPNQPIMIELTDKDKENISNMYPDATKYAIFDDDTRLTREQKFEWME